MGGQTFYVGDGGGNDNVDGEEEKENISKVNIILSKVSKPSTGARILEPVEPWVYSLKYSSRRQSVKSIIQHFYHEMRHLG